MRIEFGGRAPKVTDSAWIAPGTVLLGGVTVGDEASIWFGAVVRADNDRIEIGSRTNIQDGCVIHVDPGHPVVIGKGVSVGHRAVLHGCTVGDDVLIGMGAIVMNGAHIGARQHRRRWRRCLRRHRRASALRRARRTGEGPRDGVGRPAAGDASQRGELRRARGSWSGRLTDGGAKGTTPDNGGVWRSGATSSSRGEMRQHCEYSPVVVGRVREVELEQHVAYVRLDGAAAEEQPSSDPALVSPSAISASISRSRSVSAASPELAVVAPTRLPTTSGSWSHRRRSPRRRGPRPRRTARCPRVPAPGPQRSRPARQLRVIRVLRCGAVSPDGAAHRGHPVRQTAEPRP